MNILIFNIGWMSFNVFLALVAVLFGGFMVKSRNYYLKLFNAFVWLLFVPNTIYLFTDIIHLPEQWPDVEATLRILLVAQYLILVVIGAVTFSLAITLFEKSFFKKKMKHHTAILIILNFVIGFGIVLGRIQRTNSWEVFTNIPKVLTDTFGVFMSVELILVTILFGLLCNFTYFSMNKIKFFK